MMAPRLSYRFALMVVVLFAGWCTGFAQTVSEIRVQARDLSPIDPAAVMGFVSINTGDAISRDALSRDVRAMERSGRFSFVAADIETTPGGIAVVYTVELKPRIRRLVVDGARYLSNRKVRDLLEVGAGDPVDDALLATRAQAVREHYRKKYFPFADLSWTITRDPETGTADVVIRVDEGRRAKVKKVTFEGNDHVASRTLRRVMKQRSRHMFSWITGSGTYNPDDLAADLTLLRRVYLGEGYLDVKIGQPVIQEVGRDRIVINIPLEEGPQYILGDISISGITLFDPPAVRAVITNRPGDVASSDALQGMTRTIRDYYGSRGYIETIVSYQLDPDLQVTAQDPRPVVDVGLSVREGQLAYIRAIRFRGNTKTRDKVLRREVTVFPGEVMNEVKLRTSENRLRNLGFFSSVAAVPEPTPDPERYDAVFEVVEQNTGQFMVGAGFSSIDNLIGFVELQQGNFDVANWPPVGGGQKLRLRGTAGTKRNDIELSLTEPWFLDRRLSLGGTLFRRDSRFLSDDYRQRNTGLNITLGVPVARFTRLNLIYGLEEISVYDVDEDASQRIQDEEGDRIKSSFTTELIFDTRDNVFIPTRGLRAMVSAMVAGGPLQGETDIYRFDAMASHFWPLWFDHVFNLRFWTATVDYYGDSERVPIFDRLFLGGARTLRGFKFRQVGPKDEQGEPVGGSTMWSASAEYTIPVVRQVRFATFYDIGMVYEKAFDIDWNEYNSDVGIGIRFDIPGFPLRFDYAWPLETDEFNDRSSGRFQFSIGYSF
ncbi:MAG TPA: outer membrane protein assembly factor BamA [Kiritimatiellia bacterium]|nr:outer membrane protein assembly factor BamA [Kiritimatiellia bacterium]HMO98861.1 outer membrane protein assembly factor BamA [Kiritimatiellia bacterium]HMP97282.1 outer membrane protein assembly factor BamA [Kiritimatiellia bacterium]